jgi:hypothetical protein
MERALPFESEQGAVKDEGSNPSVMPSLDFQRSNKAMDSVSAYFQSNPVRPANLFLDERFFAIGKARLSGTPLGFWLDSPRDLPPHNQASLKMLDTEETVLLTRLQCCEHPVCRHLLFEIARS